MPSQAIRSMEYQLCVSQRELHFNEYIRKQRNSDIIWFGTDEERERDERRAYSQMTSAHHGSAGCWVLPLT